MIGHVFAYMQYKNVLNNYKIKNCNYKDYKTTVTGNFKTNAFPFLPAVFVKLPAGRVTSGKFQPVSPPSPFCLPAGVEGSNFSKNKKSLYTSYSKLSEVKLLTIGIASPLRILQWAEKTLPNGKIYGEVLNANTLHHKTFRPQKGGLFCERIFGPLKDFECACGKIDKSVKQEFSNSIFRQSTKSNENTLIDNKTNLTVSSSAILDEKFVEASSRRESQKGVHIRKFCPVCDVEYTWSVIRRYQLGYIKLISPVTHLWFLKGTPSYLSILLNIKKRHLQFVTYCSETLTLENSLAQNTKGILIDSPSKIFESWKTVVDMKNQEGVSQKSRFDNDFKKKPSSSVLQKKERIKKRTLKEAMPNKGWKQNNLALKDNKTDYSPLLFSFNVTNSEKKGSHVGDSSMFSFLNNQKKTLFQFSGYSELNQKHHEHNLPGSSDFLGYPEKTNLKDMHKFLYFHENSLLKKNFLRFKKDVKVKETRKIGYVTSQKPALIKKSFDLTHIVSAVQLSIYYNSLNLSRFPKHKANPKNILEVQQLHSTNFGLDFQNTHTKLEATLYKISQKLPVNNYILCLLEEKVYKHALLLALNKTWDLIYKEAYFKALNKVKKIQTKYFNAILDDPAAKLLQTYTISELSTNNILEATILTSTFFKEDKFASIMQESKNIQKIMAYKLSSKNLSKILGKLKNNYRNHALTILKKIKQPLFASKYSTSINHNTPKIIFNLSKDIENLLRNDTGWMIHLLSQYLLKNMLFGSYLANIEGTKEQEGCKGNVASVPANKNNKEKRSVKDLLYNYSNFVSIKKMESLSRVFPLRTEPSEMKKAKTYPLDKAFLLNQKKIKTLNHKSKDNLSYKAKHQIFNTVYSLSHLERWETEKDWYIFTLFNSSSVEYLDTPIYAYKKRLFSYSFNFIQESDTANSVVSPDTNLLHPPLPTGNKRDLSFSPNLLENSQTATGKEAISLSAGRGKLLPNGREELFQKKAEILYSSSFYSGPGIVKQLLNEFDFTEIKKLDKQNRLSLYQLNKSIFKLKKRVQVFIYDKTSRNELKKLCNKRNRLIRRTKLVRKLFRKNSDPSSMILTVLPVLPPDLRPIVKMGGQIAASDLNRLYQRVIYRNERLKKFLKDPATSQSYEMKYAQRLLQESVDNLIQNGKSGINSEKDARGRALKSLSDSLKGKQGRFRQFLLGKRVDYSGRSVIVVGPKLKLHECGLPIEMAKELYLPFLLKMILNKNYAKTVFGAKALIKKNPALTSELLREIMQVSPVLLNRAPTLHRLGFQAFVPKLIEGRAILLHPLVCSAFNADFDGDQMAVHVPITIEARAEAWKLMLSRNNILSPATGEPLAIPSQDMVLGCYYLTTYSNKGTILLLKGSGIFFNNFEDVIRAYNQQKINVHALVWVKWTGLIENGSDQEEPIEIRLTNHGQWQEITVNYYRIYDHTNRLITQYVATTPGRILFNSFITNNMK